MLKSATVRCSNLLPFGAQICYRSVLKSATGRCSNLLPFGAEIWRRSVLKSATARCSNLLPFGAQIWRRSVSKSTYRSHVRLVWTLRRLAHGCVVELGASEPPCLELQSVLKSATGRCPNLLPFGAEICYRSVLKSGAVRCPNLLPFGAQIGYR